MILLPKPIRACVVVNYIPCRRTSRNVKAQIAWEILEQVIDQVKIQVPPNPTILDQLDELTFDCIDKL